jgi:5-methylcytosine-specific restriction endonuclease McrA
MANALKKQRQDAASSSSKPLFPTQPLRTSASASASASALAPAKVHAKAEEEAEAEAEVSSGSTVTMDLPANDSRKRKQPIPKNVRVIVWNHYIGEDIIKHRCLCCKKVVISNTSFEVGHVISDKNGGTHEINNLRPICFACNHSMGSENMIDFVVKFGLYIG